MLTNTVPLKTQDLLNAIHIKYEQATDTPALTDDDGKIRLSLINEGINRWESEDGVRWRELWTFNASVSPIAVGQVTYAINVSDYRELGSRLRCVRSDGSRFFVPIVSQETYARHIDENKIVACVSGNVVDGFQINLGWVPVANDGTIDAVPYYDYYRYARRMNRLTDTPEMSNPFFLIDFATAELFVNDDVNLYTKFNGDCLAKLSNMREDNEKLPAFESNAGEDQGDGNFAMGV